MSSHLVIDMQWVTSTYDFQRKSKIKLFIASFPCKVLKIFFEPEVKLLYNTVCFHRLADSPLLDHGSRPSSNCWK